MLYRKHNNRVFLKCREAYESEKVLQDLHDGTTGGHFAESTIAHKVMRAGFYWPTLFKDAHACARKCLVCRRCTDRVRRSAAPLHPVVVTEPFQQWGLDIIGEIFLHSSKQDRYILTITNYFMRWTKEVLLKQVNNQEVINFLQ